MTSPTKPVVLIAEELAPSVIDVLGDGFEIRHVDGADRAALLPALADVDAVIDPQRHPDRRRGARRRAAAEGRRPGRHRAGQRRRAGRDRARRHGRQRAAANIVSAAEQAVALLLAVRPQHRRRQRARSRRASGSASKCTGVEVADKTVGVVGLGRIGVLFAQRMAAFGTRLIAYDPYVQPARAAQLGVRLVALDELLRESDFISIHLPKTPETVGPDRRRSSWRCASRACASSTPPAAGWSTSRRSPRRSRAARSAAPGIDVFAKEPCTDSPLFAFDNVVVTPHLGASTVEAQDKAGIAVAR